MKAAPNRKKHEPQSSFGTLVAMQWKATQHFSFRNGVRGTLTQVGLYLLGVTAVTAILWLASYLTTKSGLFGSGGKLADVLWNLLLYAVLIINFVSSLKRAVEVLYFSPDNPVLLSLPVPINQVFASKIVVLFIRNLVRYALTLLPLAISYAVLCEAPVYGYFWCVFCWLVVVVLNDAITAVVSIPVYYISLFLRQKPQIKSLILLALLGFATWLLFYAVGQIPEEISLVAKWYAVYLPAMLSFAKGIEPFVGPLVFISVLFTGYDFGEGSLFGPTFNVLTLDALWILLVIFAVIAVCVCLAVFLVRRFYFSMATKPVEYSKKETPRKKNKTSSSWLSVFKKNALIAARSSDVLAGTYLLVMICPLATLVMNALFDAMKRSSLGQLLSLVVNGLIISLILMATNVSLSSVFSREAQNATSLFSDPVSIRRGILSRIIVRAVLMVASLAITIAVYSAHSTFAFIRADVFFFCLLFVFGGHFIWSVELDFMDPQHHLYAQSSSQIAFNPNELKSSILAFVLSIAFAGLLFFFINESVSLGIYHLLLVSDLFFLARLWLFIQKVRAYGSLPFEGRNKR